MMTRNRKKAGRGYTREDWIQFHHKIVERSKQKESSDLERNQNKTEDLDGNNLSNAGQNSDLREEVPNTVSKDSTGLRNKFLGDKSKQMDNVLVLNNGKLGIVRKKTDHEVDQQGRSTFNLGTRDTNKKGTTFSTFTGTNMDGETNIIGEEKSNNMEIEISSFLEEGEQGIDRNDNERNNIHMYRGKSNTAPIQRTMSKGRNNRAAYVRSISKTKRGKRY